MPRYKTEDIEEALRHNNGLISLAARQLGMARSSLYDRVKKTVRLQKVVNDYREEIVDLAEAKLRASVMNGDAWSVSLVLKTLGPNRGYVERTETEHSGEVIINVRYESDSDPSKAAP